MPGLNLVGVLNPKSKEQGILHDKCFMKSTHSMVMPTEIWQFSLLSLSLLYFPIRASGHTVEPCCSCPCLWSLIHHFSDITSCVWKKQAGETELSLNFFISVCTSACIFLASLSHFFHSVSSMVFLFSLLFQCLVSLGWKMTSQSVGKGSRSCWPWLSWATSVCICKPVLLWWSMNFSVELEPVGSRSSRIW